MRRSDNTERVRGWIVDYSIATARAIEWLGDRYLLAKPINRRFTQSRTGNGPHAPPIVPRTGAADLP